MGIEIRLAVGLLGTRWPSLALPFAFRHHPLAEFPEFLRHRAAYLEHGLGLEFSEHDAYARLYSLQMLGRCHFDGIDALAHSAENEAACRA